MLDEDAIYWDTLRAQSLRPGGFGKERIRLWPSLLGVHVPQDPPPYAETSTLLSTDDTPHPDERQVRLDTDRSFVIYSAEDDDDENTRESLQRSLNSLIVSLLRKRRKLHYFQGYHDIVTVIFLTLPPELQLPCVEKLSLHRVRDSMGPTLEPVLGLLRILRNLLRVVDPPYASLLESVAPLPFHALSNLLTLFSHEVPTLPLIQHVWDFLLCREPLAVVWLAAAVILARKPDVLKLAAEDEDGMIHSVLNALPLLHEGTETKIDVPSDQYTQSESPNEASDKNATNEQQQQITEPKQGSCSNGTLQDAANGRAIREDNEMNTNAAHSADDRYTQQSENLHPALFLAQEAGESAVISSLETPIDSNADIDVDIDAVRLRLSHHSTNHSGSSASPTLSRSGSRTQSRSSSFSVPPVKFSQAPISLPSLLTHAAQLLDVYPPTLPELHIRDILGPKSAIHTWRPPLEEPLSMRFDIERDDEAESWVGGPDVVIPFIDDEDIQENEGERKTKSRNGPVTKRRFLFPRMHLRFGVLTPAERRFLLVGVVTVLGLAITLRQNRSLVDIKRGWVAWIYEFVRPRTATLTTS